MCDVVAAFALISAVGMQRERQPEGKHPVLCLKGTQSAIALGNGLDAVATVAVTDPRGNRQTIPDHYLTCIGILDQHKNIALPDITRKAYPLIGNFWL